MFPSVSRVKKPWTKLIEDTKKIEKNISYLQDLLDKILRDKFLANLLQVFYYFKSKIIWVPELLKNSDRTIP